VPIILFALLLFVLLAFGGVIVLSLALRYRAGTARRQGRRWVATVNVWATSFSAAFFLCFTFLLSFWLGPTLRFALAGMAIGGLLGLLGMVLTRWESHPEGFFYTPSRWLALLVMLAIAARLIYGWWHTMHRSASSDQHWLWSASGTQLSVAVAAGLIGYYWVYAIGVRIRITRYEKRRHD
jgi:MFS family permease